MRVSVDLRMKKEVCMMGSERQMKAVITRVYLFRTDRDGQGHAGCYNTVKRRRSKEYTFHS